MPKSKTHTDPSASSGTSPTARNFFRCSGVGIPLAADYIGVTPSWLEEQIQKGNVPYRMAGESRVVLRADLEALILQLPVERGKREVPVAFRKVA